MPYHGAEAAEAERKGPDQGGRGQGEDSGHEDRRGECMDEEVGAVPMGRRVAFPLLSWEAAVAVVGGGVHDREASGHFVALPRNPWGG
jgi:hypothetical protein